MVDALARFEAAVARFSGQDLLFSICGSVCEASSSHLLIAGLSRHANIGDLVSIRTQSRHELAEIVRIDDRRAVAVPFQRQSQVHLGDTAVIVGRPKLRPDHSWLGRVLDPLGNPLDRKGALGVGPHARPVECDPPRALDRGRVEKPLKTGVKAIDVFTPLCRGQRMGIFAGSGVGKSTLLSMLSNVPDVSAVVLALVGERGREVREFLEDVLGPRAQRVVAVVATGDDNPAVRRMAPKSAMTIAEYFREQGEQVLLLIDSVTRFAHAQRECALASGEPPVARGYPPSVFSEIARLLERGGPGLHGEGDITTLVTVLVDGDNHNDPVSDATRGILDGHIVLDRKIAAQGRWPAIDVLASLSRLAIKALGPEEAKIAATARAMMARYEDTRDLRLIGGYQPGTEPDLDRAVARVPKLYDLICQGPFDRISANIFAEVDKIQHSP